jgi:DNA-binding Xre family transcriptional regulator
MMFSNEVLEKLCEALDCNVVDIIEYIPEDK